MDQNMRAQDPPAWSPLEPMDYDFSDELSQLLNQPITQSHPTPMDYDVDYVYNQANFSTHKPPLLLHQQMINTLPAFPFTAVPELPVGESSQGMLHNEGYNSGYASQHFSSPLMEVVQGAKPSSSRQTRCETGNSSRRPYVPWSIEDVTQLIRAVHKQGAKVKRWDLIVQLPYFKDKGRKKEHLMEKWRHMTGTKMGTKDPKCPMMKELYIWARQVEAKLQ